jgi:hydrophobic/amphiphilic exporter-1 (mainly G- bacteria), HAE1 family
MGKRPYQAAIDAADEIGLAVVATTLTIVVVFVPVSFMTGLTGEYFRQFGLTVAYAVLLSLVVARLLTPLMAAYVLVPNQRQTIEGRLIGDYRVLLEWTLAHRRVTLAIGICIFVASVALAVFIPTGFVPADDASQTTISLEIPPGATIDDAQRVAASVTAKLKANPAVASVFIEFGGAASGEVGGTNTAISRGSATINLRPRSERIGSLKDFQAVARSTLATIPDLRVAVNKAGGGRDISVIFVSDDAVALDKAVAAITADMAALPMLAGVRSTAPLPRTEVLIQPRRDEAARLGITPEQIALVTRVSTLGDIDQNLTKLNLGSRQIPIRVRITDAARDDIARISNLRVTTPGGNQVPLRLFADIKLATGEATIERFNRQRRAAIEADLVGNTPLGTAFDAIKSLPSYQNLPVAVRQPATGDQEVMNEIFGQFGRAMTAGILMIYVVLVLLFKDFLQPLTIMTALPLSLCGAFLALMVTGKPFDILSLIGLLMLMGIVCKNSILLVENAIEQMRAGLDRNTAVVDAGVQRARPIIMTSIAMVAGMLVPAFGIGPGAETRAPMAIVVIGGLITSTMFSLVFVPVVFIYIDEFSHTLSRRLSRLTTVTSADIAAEAASNNESA